LVSRGLPCCRPRMSRTGLVATRISPSATLPSIICRPGGRAPRLRSDRQAIVLIVPQSHHRCAPQNISIVINFESTSMPVLRALAAQLFPARVVVMVHARVNLCGYGIVADKSAERRVRRSQERSASPASPCSTLPGGRDRHCPTQAPPPAQGGPIDLAPATLPDPESDEAVAEMRSCQELRRKIGISLGVRIRSGNRSHGGYIALHHAVANGVGEGHVPVVARRVPWQFSLKAVQVFDQGCGNRICPKSGGERW
jgi:hypothetical protein